MSNQLSDKERRIISEVLKKNLRDFQDTEVFLFGSMAAGGARPSSDIDLAIKSKGPLDKAVWSKIESDFDDSDLTREVDVVDYWRITEDFRKVIAQNGQRILATKVHPFRLCPTGYHWVSTHVREIPPGLRHPIGSLTEVDGHCRVNPGSESGRRKEVLSADEVREMFERHGKHLTPSLPKFKDPRKAKWSRFDREIEFWTRFWNEIFVPEEKLDPIFVKALIASESGFDPKPPPQYAGSSGWAKGLIQITDETLRVLNSPQSGEISDFNFKFSGEDLDDPNVSIAAGIRWLFHKKRLASNALKKEASWREAVINYKGYLKDYKKNPDTPMKGLGTLEDNFNELAAGH